MEKARILIAEDEKNQRDLLEGFLKKEGFSVGAVSNGREALQALRENFFDGSSSSITKCLNSTGFIP